MYKKQFVLTVISNNKLKQKILTEINNAITGHKNIKKNIFYEPISDTYRYNYQFSPIVLENNKRKIQNLQNRHKNDLVIFLDEYHPVGFGKILGRIFITIDKIIGFLIPTTATIFYQSNSKRNYDVQNSLNEIFFAGDDKEENINIINFSGSWYKVKLKINEPLMFKRQYEKFRKANERLVTAADVTRKEKRDYLPYLGLLGFISSIIQFREAVVESVNKVIDACSSFLGV